jgi:hypothetical protein
MGISQEEIVTNAQTVTKGLEALRLEHQSLLGGLKVGDNVENKVDCGDGGIGKENEALREKCSLLEVNLECLLSNPNKMFVILGCKKISEFFNLHLICSIILAFPGND